MFTHSTEIRVRYAETDQMSQVYYGIYATYFEIGRVEAMRSLGIRYADLESKHGLLMPVVNMHVRYLRPARYDDLLKMTTGLRHLPGDKIVYHTDIYLPPAQHGSGQAKLSVAGRVELCFLESESRKRIPTPEFILEKLIPYFK